MKLKELADQLGLSQTTVSRALNGYPEVSEATRQRVLEAARRFHYRPNVSARRLATGRAGAIGRMFAQGNAVRGPLTPALPVLQEFPSLPARSGLALT